ncbi:MAG: sigma-70 family RNA polymerase sigma factor [Lentisphaeria bacterium]|nr:sigma-70 family RNA polymerase sigma factor [Lentisphaeria bacterium]
MPEPQPDHAQWIRDALQTHEHSLLQYAGRLLRGDTDRARDVVQDTFLKLCRQPREKIDDHLAQWLFTVCRNRAFEILRKEGRMTPLNDSDLAVRAAEAPDPAAGALRRDRLSAVVALLGELPERQQELIRLKFHSNLSYKEISGIMDLSVSNVGYLLHTGMRTLRRRLGEMETQTRESLP